MQKLRLTGLSLLSGLLMGITWPATGNLALLSFIALIPLLYVEYTISQNGDKFKPYHVFLFSYLTFITFNTFTTWWIWFASEAGMVMAEVLYSLFMAITFLAFHLVKKRLGTKRGYFGFIILWIGFEWLHFNWEFSHPWNPLGNVFANYTEIIQWYEYTGVLGGTLWVLLVNIILFNLLRKTVILDETLKANLKLLISALLILLIPVISSLIIYTNYEEEVKPSNIVIVQPNIDPYYDKFNNMTEAEQVDLIFQLARQKVTPNTDYVVAPETAIPRGTTEDQLENNYGIRTARQLIEDFPNVKVVIGISSYIDYKGRKEKPTLTARQDMKGTWYDAFNTALLIDHSPIIQIYHKSKLVLGVEKLPYPKFFSFLEKFAIDLGGTMGSLGSEKESKNFIDDVNQVAPVICYESIFGDYCASYVKKGANMIFIITNDGWWRDTPGYKQHLAYARLRAIETRRSIARSANTGTSCFIDQHGEVISPTKWWVPDVISGTINSNHRKTFYSKYGDYIGRISAALSVLLIMWSISARMKQKFNPVRLKN